MNQLSLHIPAIYVRKMPQFSYMLNTDFEWLKFVGTGLEIRRFDYQLLPLFRSQNLRAPVIFYSKISVLGCTVELHTRWFEYKSASFAMQPLVLVSWQKACCFSAVAFVSLASRFFPWPFTFILSHEARFRWDVMSWLR